MRQFTDAEFDEMRTNRNNYVLWYLYVNKSDPRIILPKRNKWMGWTLNFAHPISYLALGTILAAICGVSFVL